MDYSTPGFPVLHCLLEFAQTHVCCVSDAIQPSNPLSAPSASALNLSQHWGQKSQLIGKDSEAGYSCARLIEQLYKCLYCFSALLG